MVGLAVGLGLVADARASGGASLPGVVRGPETVIVLVRHAETTPDGTRDPALSPAGMERAARLVTVVRGIGVASIHSTPYRRTMETARPTAAALGLDVVGYDPGGLAGFAAGLAVAGDRHLVVGHSNTTPELVRLLGGEAGEPIAEDEHDRVYVLRLADGRVRTTVLRY